MLDRLAGALDKFQAWMVAPPDLSQSEASLY